MSEHDRSILFDQDGRIKKKWKAYGLLAVPIYFGLNFLSSLLNTTVIVASFGPKLITTVNKTVPEMQAAQRRDSVKMDSGFAIMHRLSYNDGMQDSAIHYAVRTAEHADKLSLQSANGVIDNDNNIQSLRKALGRLK